MHAPVAPERPPFLDQLPSFEPHERVWAGVLAARAAARRRAWLSGAAAGAVFALAAGWQLTRERTDAPAPLAVGPEQSRALALEVELLEARATRIPRAAEAARVESELARVDAALQTAYERRADAAELGRLWHARSELESALLAAYQRPADLVRL